MSKILKILCIVIPLSLLSCSPDKTDTVVSPYPKSQVISDISLDWSTYERRAPGSDNWPITWADDNNQYTSWGDGGGFGGSNTEGRVSLGCCQNRRE